MREEEKLKEREREREEKEGGKRGRERERRKRYQDRLRKMKGVFWGVLIMHRRVRTTSKMISRVLLRPWPEGWGGGGGDGVREHSTYKKQRGQNGQRLKVRGTI